MITEKLWSDAQRQVLCDGLVNGIIAVQRERGKEGDFVNGKKKPILVWGETAPNNKKTQRRKPLKTLKKNPDNDAG